jgi:hypothetical protein
MSHYGKSPEERELAGEEVGISLTDAFRSLAGFAKSPVGKAASAVVPLPLRTALAAAAATKGKPKQKEIVDRKPAPSAPAAAPGAPPPSAIAGMTFIGADPPMTHAQVQALIRREGNPFKQMRMVENYRRSRMR